MYTRKKAKKIKSDRYRKSIKAKTQRTDTRNKVLEDPEQ